MREFANQKALIDHAEQNGLVYVWAFSMREQLVSPAFTKRQQMLSPDQYEIVDVRTLRGVRRALLFPKAILQAEFAANATVRQRLWRREIDKVGQGGCYQHSTKPGPNTLVIERHECLEGIAVVFSARFAATISPLTAEHLAELAIESARREIDGRDGITYLMNAKRSGIVTPLSDSYEQEILRRTETYNLAGALHKIQRNSTSE